MAWTLMYENSDAGATLAGSLTDLIQAIESGAEVRVLTEFTDPTTGIVTKIVRKAQWVFVRNEGSGPDDVVVYAQNTEQIAIDILSAGVGQQINFADDSYHYFEMVNTKGYREANRWFVGAHVSRGHSTNRVGVKWFVFIATPH